MELENKISELVNQIINHDDVFLYDVLVKGNVGNQKVQVFIDGDQPVNVSECSTISRKLAEEIESQSLITGKYILEVSSPGAGKPLKYLRQYPKHIGRELEVITKNQNIYTGILKKVVQGEIYLESQKKKGIDDEFVKIEANDISSAKVIVKI